MLDVAFMNVPYHVLQIKFGLLHLNKQTMCNCKLPAWEYFQCHRVKSTLWLYSLLIREVPEFTSGGGAQLSKSHANTCG